MDPLLIAVIADDLTGVCDTGAQFASAGLKAIGSVDVEFKSIEIPQVLIVNTQSRSMGAMESIHCVHQTVRRLKRFEPRWFFKKIDTALRGNIAVEVFSMMETLGIHLALFIASIPEAGRTTVSGCQLFRGIPIKDSIHGEDLLNPNPIFTSSNVELFAKVPNLEIEVVNLDEVRSGRLEILSHYNSKSKKVIIFDSETDSDIDHIVNASMKMDPSAFFFVGSLGLASGLGRFLAESLRVAKRQEKTFDQRTTSVNKAVLVISGSSHPMARSQISYLKWKGIAEVIELKPEDLLEHLDECILETAKACTIALNKLRKIVVTIGESRSNTTKQSQELITAFAKGAHHLLTSNELDGLVLVGGETSYAVCRSVGIERIEIFGTISFVAAYGRPEGSLKEIQVLVTKGGSLGEEDTLERVLNFIDLQV